MRQAEQRNWNHKTGNCWVALFRYLYLLCLALLFVFNSASANVCHCQYVRSHKIYLSLQQYLNLNTSMDNGFGKEWYLKFEICMKESRWRWNYKRFSWSESKLVVKMMSAFDIMSGPSHPIFSFLLVYFPRVVSLTVENIYVKLPHKM